MQFPLRVILMVASLLVFLSILNAIRKGILREEHSLIWLLSTMIIFFLAADKGSLQEIGNLLQVDYSPSLIFMIGLGLVVAIQLLQTVSISKLASQNRDLAQQLAIQEWYLKEVSGKLNFTQTPSFGFEDNDSLFDLITVEEKGEITDEKTESVGDRPGRGYVRFVKTLGANGRSTRAAKASGAGNSG
jgi:hypothetical protein